jgi:hypothetical protein
MAVHPRVALVGVMAEGVRPVGVAHPPVVAKLVEAEKVEEDVAEQTVCTCHS